MSLDAVKAALEGQLATIAPAIDTVHENEAYTPKVGTPYQEAYVLPAEPDNNVLSGNYQERGIFQVTLKYPPGAGAKDAIARAILTRDAFPRGLSLVKSGITTIIERTPEIAPGANTEDRYLLPVRVRFYANVPS